MECKQTITPQVDNSTSECTECGYTKTICIVLSEDIEYLGLNAGDSLDDVITKLIDEITSLKEEVDELRTLITP
jgi:hypothetical protein